jgi:hypothetical protein
VTRRRACISEDAWRSVSEKESLLRWVLKAESVMHVHDRIRLFEEVGHTGDCYWFIAD